MESKQQSKITFPKPRTERDSMNWYAKHRQKNFRNIVLKTKWIDFYQMSPWNDDEPSSFGIQWFSGMQTPSVLFGYPDQLYWKTHSLVFMLGRKRFVLSIRGKKMPFVNFDSYVQWKRLKRTTAKDE